MKVSCILDWEFAHSGTGLTDCANFVRFEDEVDFDVVRYLIKGYEKENRIPENWRKIGKFIDLASMCSFLTRDRVGIRTQKTALEIIKKTIAESNR